MMQFQTKLLPATLIKRYKRFLVDVQLGDRNVVTAHCANPGSMLGLAEPGTKIWIEPNADPKKKLKYAWRLSEYDDKIFVCIDTSHANRMVGEALEQRQLTELGTYVTVRPEVKYGDNSRIDFLLENDAGKQTFVEVKSVTLSRRSQIAEFPDSVTKRGAKHLDALAQMVQAGHRAVMLYLVQRTDCKKVSVAQDIDPLYAQRLSNARAIGVEILCYQAELSPACQKVGKNIEFL